MQSFSDEKTRVSSHKDCNNKMKKDPDVTKSEPDHGQRQDNGLIATSHEECK